MDRAAWPSGQAHLWAGPRAKRDTRWLRRPPIMQTSTVMLVALAGFLVALAPSAESSPYEILGASDFGAETGWCAVRLNRQSSCDFIMPSKGPTSNVYHFSRTQAITAVGGFTELSIRDSSGALLERITCTPSLGIWAYEVAAITTPFLSINCSTRHWRDFPPAGAHLRATYSVEGNPSCGTELGANDPCIFRGDLHLGGILLGAVG